MVLISLDSLNVLFRKNTPSISVFGDIHNFTASEPTLKSYGMNAYFLSGLFDV